MSTLGTFLTWFESVTIAPHAVTPWVTSYHTGTNLLILLVHPFHIEPRTFENAGKMVVSVYVVLAEDT